MKRIAARPIDLAVVAAILVLTPYAAYRAARLPITIDESVSYLYFARAPVGDILSPDFTHSAVVANPGWAANNHVLNSVLEKFSAAAFGPSPFALRLPNLVALVVYLAFSWLLLRRLRPVPLAVSGFVLLAFNPFLIDYFTLSRGYGLSLGFLMPGLFFLLGDEVPAERRDANRWIGWFFMALGVLASFVLADVFIALALVLAIRGAESLPSSGAGRVSQIVRRAAPFAVVSLFLAAAAGPNVVGLKRIGALYLGGRSGFWRDTVGSLVDATLYSARYGPGGRRFILAVVVALSLGAAASTVAGFVRRSPDRPTGKQWGLLLFLTVGMRILEHRAFGVNFRVDRAALYLVPIFILAVASSVAALRNLRLLKVGSGVLAALAAACLVHFAASMNVRRFFFCVWDMDTPELIDDLTRVHARSGRPIFLEAEWQTAPGIDFYRVVRRLDWLTWDNLAPDWSRADFVYALPSHASEIARHGYRIVKTYPRSGNVLGTRTVEGRHAGLGRPSYPEAVNIALENPPSPQR